MTQAKPRFQSLEDFLNYDDGTDARYELVDGELVELPTESWDAGAISLYLFTQLLACVPYYLLRHKDTEIAVPSSSVRARIPDLMVVSEATAVQMSGRKGLIPLDSPPPILVVEVVSPGEPGTQNYDRDYLEKPQEYALRGIPEYWLIDPERSIVRVLSLSDQAYEVREFRGSQQLRCAKGDRIISLMFPTLQLTADQILRAGR